MITMNRALASGRYSEAVIEKARRLFVAGGIQPDPEYPNVFWVTSGSERGRKYRVQLYEHFASCSCAHGIHTGADATCAHPLAAMAYAAANGLEIEAKPDEPAERPLPEGHTIVGTEIDWASAAECFECEPGRPCPRHGGEQPDAPF